MFHFANFTNFATRPSDSSVMAHIHVFQVQYSRPEPLLEFVCLFDTAALPRYTLPICLTLLHYQATHCLFVQLVFKYWDRDAQEADVPILREVSPKRAKCCNNHYRYAM
jgi:hypothetical protein